MNTLWGEAVSVAGSVAFKQSVTFELAQIVAQLVQTIRSFGETEGRADGLVDFLRGPAADVSAAMQQNLEEPNDSSVVDFDAGIADRTDGDRQRNPLQKREVDVNVEPLGLEASEAAGDDFEGLADASRLSNPFLRPKSLRLLEQSSLRKNVANFSYCFRKACLK